MKSRRTVALVLRFENLPHRIRPENVKNVEKWHKPRNLRLKSLWKTFHAVFSIWKIPL